MNELMNAIAEHLTIVAVSMFFAAILGIALGVLAYWRRKLGSVIISIAELIQTIPSLALLALLMIIFGLGDLTMGVALVLYALLPIIRNTYTSLTAQGGDSSLHPHDLLRLQGSLGQLPLHRRHGRTHRIGRLGIHHLSRNPATEYGPHPAGSHSGSAHSPSL